MIGSGIRVWDWGGGGGNVLREASLIMHQAGVGAFSSSVFKGFSPIEERRKNC